MSEVSDWINTYEAAQFLQVTRRRVAQLCKAGKLTWRKFGRAYQISRASLIALDAARKRARG